ncbi:MAG: hypothetical protein RDV41_10795 [Planctomycetota bacterium]|nr:hypothetical protein [Planctomycetota bacterium]
MLALAFAVVLAGCRAQGREDGSVAGKQPEPALLRTLYTLDGVPWHASAFLQDTVRSGSENGVETLRIERIEYLMLVVSHTDCEWTRRFMTDAVRLVPELGKASLRIVLALSEKGGKGASEWREFDSERIKVLQDKEGEMYRFYVRGKTPSVSIVDRQSNLIFRCEGYISPEILLQSLNRREFGGVKGGEG